MNLPLIPLVCRVLQALMGPSGAGKSTLMDILAMRKTVGQLSGCLLVDGQPATQTFLKKASYVPQVSLLLDVTGNALSPASTVRRIVKTVHEFCQPSASAQQVAAVKSAHTACHIKSLMQ
jgi:ABC-type multidrug transport system ATPase subunit